MSRTVFILGAGASREGGGPLMGDFVEIAEALHQSNAAPDYTEDFKTFLTARQALIAVHMKAVLDVDNIESLLGAFEMARLLGSLGGLDAKILEGLPSATRRVINATLCHRIQYRADVSGRRVLPPIPYNRFGQIIGEINSSNHGKVTIITFNYDLAVDYSFHFHQLRTDYCLDGGAHANAIPLLKLHGSLNWTRCGKCDAVVPLTMQQFWQTHEWAPFRKPDQTMQLVVSGGDLSRLKHCEEACSEDPIIVPPTWNKTQYHTAIANVWRRAAQELSDAEHIVVVGYSMPSTDQFFHYLLSLGMVGKSFLRNLVVCDPDERVAGRFESLLSSATRPRLSRIHADFSSALEQLQQKLKWTGSR